MGKRWTDREEKRLEELLTMDSGKLEGRGWKGAREETTEKSDAGRVKERATKKRGLSMRSKIALKGKGRRCIQHLLSTWPHSPCVQGEGLEGDDIHFSQS